MEHQVSIPTPIWQHFQKKYGVKNPSTNIREELWKIIIADTAGVQQVDTLKARWREMRLSPDPTDHVYMAAREAWINKFESEADAVEAAEIRYAHGYDGKVKNMRGWIIAWHKDGDTWGKR